MLNSLNISYIKFHNFQIPPYLNSIIYQSTFQLIKLIFIVDIQFWLTGFHKEV